METFVSSIEGYRDMMAVTQSEYRCRQWKYSVTTDKFALESSRYQTYQPILCSLQETLRACRIFNSYSLFRSLFWYQFVLLIFQLHSVWLRRYPALLHLWVFIVSAFSPKLCEITQVQYCVSNIPISFCVSFWRESSILWLLSWCRMNNNGSAFYYHGQWNYISRSIEYSATELCWDFTMVAPP